MSFLDPHCKLSAMVDIAIHPWNKESDPIATTPDWTVELAKYQPNTRFAVKCRILAPFSTENMRNLSTHAADTVLSTARQSTLVVQKSIEYAQLWSGSIVLGDNTEKPAFVVPGRFWPDF